MDVVGLIKLLGSKELLQYAIDWRAFTACGLYRKC